MVTITDLKHCCGVNKINQIYTIGELLDQIDALNGKTIFRVTYKIQIIREFHVKQCKTCMDSENFFTIILKYLESF